MAIKFRCRHCRQFLGISVNRAGLIVDCPTCGRTIRVPDLDGRVRPLPSPQLDLDDSGLVDALHEVARIGEPPSTETMNVAAALNADKAGGVIEPVPLPEPAPIDPPMPIEAAPAPRAVTIEEDESEAPVPNAEERERDLIAELEQLANLPATPVRRASDRSDPFRRIVRQLAAPTVLVALLIAAALALGMGILLGRATAPQSSPAKAGHGAIAGNAPEKPAVPAHGEASVRGRITFKSQSGDSSPDTGAKVIVFPIQDTNGEKLAVAGFRVGAAEADLQAARESLRKLGGDVAVADEAGNFELTLPAAGTYPLLVLSRSQQRDKDRPVEQPLKLQLEKLFDRPESLPGDVRYHFGRIRYRGTGPELWDDVFEGE